MYRIHYVLFVNKTMLFGQIHTHTHIYIYIYVYINILLDIFIVNNIDNSQPYQINSYYRLLLPTSAYLQDDTTA